MAIYQRGNIYHFKKRIPKELKLLPQFYGRGDFFSQSLKTDSKRVAERRALAILAQWETLRPKTPSCEFEQWTQAYRADEASLEYSHREPGIKLDIDEYRSLVTDDLLKTKPKSFEIRLDALHEQTERYSSSVLSLQHDVIKAKEAAGKSGPRSVNSKIKRGCDWLLSCMRASDTDLRRLSWLEVNKLVQVEINNGTSSNTIQGYLYGLRQIWKFAYKTGLVETRESPFDEHDISNTTRGFDRFSWDEIKALYQKSTKSKDLQLAIKIAATTGARAGEVCDICRFDPVEFPYPLWAIKFHTKGKTKAATRLIPIHPNLAPEIPEGFKANWSYKNLIERKFSQVRHSGFIKEHDQLTDIPRRLGFHSFRVTVINHLVYEKGFPMATVSELTGHKPSYMGKEGAIAGYLRVSSLETKLAMVSSIPWVFD